MELDSKVISFWAKNAFNNSWVAPELASASEDVGGQEVTDIGSFITITLLNE